MEKFENCVSTSQERQLPIEGLSRRTSDLHSITTLVYVQTILNLSISYLDSVKQNRIIKRRYILKSTSNLQIT